MDQLFRQDLILGILPGKENALGSTAIRERVARQGLNVDLRTIQRDLSDLKEKYPHVHSRKDGRSTLWWAEKSLSRLSMLPTDAMNLTMIMDHATRFGMAAQVERLAPLRDYAVSLLKGNRPSQDVSNKITSNTRFITLQPSVVKQEVLDVIRKRLANTPPRSLLLAAWCPPVFGGHHFKPLAEDLPCQANAAPIPNPSRPRSSRSVPSPAPRLPAWP
ncbi:TPA: hypothetical protein NII53_000873 [Pseudomonas aeruginosa]|nr:hypothetical protein [Pseudomonas aeruginosa]